MKLKHRDLLIDPKQPFLNCKLKRESYADVLTKIVLNYADGFVLAINNEWGSGKTTFVKMWQQKLNNQNFRTLYFNAWENDYEGEPMVALLAELQSLNLKENSKTFKKVLKTSFALSKNLFPILVMALAEKYIDIKGLKDAIGSVSEDATILFEEEVSKYTDKKQSLSSFKHELKKYIDEECNGKPLIFIIDELDRCKPDYAVRVLECVKHFFSIEGIVFVLSIDKEQLSNAVKGFYGSESIDSANYLKRFIDIEYQIPAPEIKEFVNYLYDYFNLKEFFNNENRLKFEQLRKDQEYFKSYVELIFKKLQLSLRAQERIFAQIRLILTQFQSNHFVLPTVLFTLIYFKQYDNQIYKRIERGDLGIQEFSNEIEPFFLSLTSEHLNTKYIYSLCVVCYQKYLQEVHKFFQLIDESSDDKKLCFDTKFDELSIINLIKQIDRGRGESVSMNHLLTKINLTSELVSII